MANIGDLRLTGERFEHPRGFVSFNVMDGWQVEHDLVSATMTDPQTDVMYKITVTNTGYSLDAQSYANFREASEQAYRQARNYRETEIFENPDINLYIIEKTYIRNSDRARMYTFSLYQQFGNVIFTIELIGKSEFVQTDPLNPYKMMFNSFTQTINSSSSIAADFGMYENRWRYVVDDPQVSLLIPREWIIYADQTDNIQYTNFYSPDLAVYTQFVRVSNDMGNFTQESGFDFAALFLDIAHSNNESDIEITVGDDIELADGLYQFIWESKSAGKLGHLVYDTRVPNKLIMVVSIIQYRDLLPLYAVLLDNIKDSYRQGQIGGLSSEKLRTDTLEAIRGFEGGRGCSDVTLTSEQIETYPAQAGDSWQEQWQVNACGEVRLYQIVFTPDGVGGTYMTVYEIEE